MKILKIFKISYIVFFSLRLIIRINLTIQLFRKDKQYIETLLHEKTKVKLNINKNLFFKEYVIFKYRAK